MKPSFSLAGTLVDAMQTSGWSEVTLDLNVVDRSGVYLLTDVVGGDTVVVDTGAFEAGTTTQYTVTSVVSISGTALRVHTTCGAEPGLEPDLSWCIGSDAVVTRKVNGMLGVPAPGVQGVRDNVPFANLTSNLVGLSTRVVISTTPPNDNDDLPDLTIYFQLL